MADNPTVAVSGIGGFFFRSADPSALSQWYAKHFGIAYLEGQIPWHQEAGHTVISPFDADTDYFGGNQQFMLNLRVHDLDAALAGLASAGVPEAKPRESMEGIGHFGWVQDPEGNRIELWEPA